MELYLMFKNRLNLNVSDYFCIGKIVPYKAAPSTGRSREVCKRSFIYKH